MIEVVSIPEKTDKLMILIETITYFWLIIFALVSDREFMTVVAGLGVSVFYLFRFRTHSSLISLKSSFLGIAVFVLAQFWYKFNDGPMTQETMPINTRTAIIYISLSLTIMTCLSILKEAREDYLQLQNQKTAND